MRVSDPTALGDIVLEDIPDLPTDLRYVINNLKRCANSDDAPTSSSPDGSHLHIPDWSSIHAAVRASHSGPWTLAALRRLVIRVLKDRLNALSSSPLPAYERPVTTDTDAMLAHWEMAMKTSIFASSFSLSLKGPSAGGQLRPDAHWEVHRPSCSTCQSFPASWNEYVQGDYNTINKCRFRFILSWLHTGYHHAFQTEPPHIVGKNSPTFNAAPNAMRAELQTLIENGWAVPAQPSTVNPLLNVLKEVELLRAERALRAAGLLDPSQPLPGADRINELLQQLPPASRPFDKLKSRLCLNGAWRLNDLIPPWPYSHENVSHAVGLLTPGCYAAKIDLSAMFHQLFLAPVVRQYLGFAAPGQATTNVDSASQASSISFFQYLVVVFGLSDSPAVCNTLSGWISSVLTSRGIPNVVYTDDFLIIGATQSECQRNVDATLALLAQLGWLVNLKKCVPPTQLLEFLGVTIDTVACTLSIHPDRIQVILDEIHSLLDPTASVTAHDLESMAGRLDWVSHVMPVGRPFIYNFRAAARHVSRRNPVTLINDKLRADLIWWRTRLSTMLYSGSPAWSRVYFCGPPCIVRSFSDASGVQGFGIICCGIAIRGTWTPSTLSIKSIGYKELLPLLIILRLFRFKLQNRVLVFSTDNVSAAFALNKGSSSSPFMTELLREIYLLAEECNIGLLGDHIPREYNTVTDAMSKGQDYNAGLASRSIFIAA